MRIGIAADHGGFALQLKLSKWLQASGHQIIDFGATVLMPDDDYPDFIVPLAQAIAKGEFERATGLCASGIGASIAANKVCGVRAGLIDDVYSAHQGVEDDDMNVICMGIKTKTIQPFDFATITVMTPNEESRLQPSVIRARMPFLGSNPVFGVIGHRKTGHVGPLVISPTTVWLKQGFASPFTNEFERTLSIAPGTACALLPRWPD